MSQKTYPVIFSPDARPGVQAIGTLKRGETTRVEAAEAVRLVDVKGLRFATAADEAAARAELAGIAKVGATAEAGTPASAPADEAEH